MSIKVNEAQKDLNVFQASRRLSINDDRHLLEIHFNFFDDDYKIQIFDLDHEKLALVNIQEKLNFLKLR